MDKPKKRGSLDLVWTVEPQNNPGECQVSFLGAEITLSLTFLSNKNIISRWFDPIVQDTAVDRASLNDLWINIQRFATVRV